MFKNYPIEKLTHSQKTHVNHYNNNLINGHTKLIEIKCVICKKNNPVEIFKNDNWGLINKTVYCSSCGMVYTNPRMKEDDQNLFYSSDLYSKIYQPQTSSSSHLIKAEEKVANYKSKLSEKKITGILFLDQLTKHIDYKK